MSRIRRHLTYANVMVTILALFVLGGGTALASYVISSNKQVAPGTISGHKPPSGSHANILTGSVNGLDLADGSVGGGDLANGSVTNAKLSASSVTGAKVANDSLTLSDLKGIDESGSISFTLAAHSCGKLTIGVSGAAAGQAAVLTWTDAVPTHVVLGPLKVVDPSHVIVYACNESGVSVSRTDLGIRVVTFG
jgi:hypothetical protein